MDAGPVKFPPNGSIEPGLPALLDASAEAADIRKNSSKPDLEQLSPIAPTGPASDTPMSGPVSLDDRGNPIKPKGRRGRKPGSTNRPTQEVQPPSEFAMTAMALNGTFFLVFKSAFGDEVMPDEREAMGLNAALEGYLQSSNTTLSPGVLLLTAYTGFVATKLAKEKPRSKLSRIGNYIRGKFFSKGITVNFNRKDKTENASSPSN